MKVLLYKSPKSNKKYRVTLPNGRSVDFGGKGYSDYTIHKNPLRMRLYVQRHGGNVPSPTGDVQNKLLKVTKSNKEDWSLGGVNTAGFWSRWLLWSYPSIEGARRLMKKKFGLDIVNKSR
jgi:hypothetical protein